MPNDNRFILLIVAFAAGGYFFFHYAAPTPGSPAASSLTAVFAGRPADAQKAQQTFHALANSLEYDGTLSPPRITHDRQVQDLRRYTLDYLHRGWHFNDAYPAFGQTVGTHLDSRLGQEPKPLDAGRRQTWVQAYRDLESQAASVK